MLTCFVFVAFMAVCISFMVSLGRSLSFLVILENFNVLILFSSLMASKEDNRGLFISLLVLFTLEVTLCLVVLTRLWSTLSNLDLGVFS